MENKIKMGMKVIIFLVFVIGGAMGKSFLKEPVRPIASKENVNLEGKQIQHETECYLYYRYVYGVKIMKECPDGKLFNPEISNCDFNYNVDCGQRKIPEENDSLYEYYDVENSINDQEYSTTTTKTFECPEKEDPYEPDPLLAHEDSCNHFYRCVDGKKYLMKCPGVLQFDTKIAACDFPRNVRCRMNWRSSSTTETTSTTRQF